MPKIVLGHLPFVRTSQPDHYRTGYFDNEIGIFPRVFAEEPGADAGFFLGGGALVSCSTSTPINHIVLFFFAEYQLYEKTAGHLREGCAPPAPSP